MPRLLLGLAVLCRLALLRLIDGLGFLGPDSFAPLLVFLALGGWGVLTGWLRGDLLIVVPWLAWRSVLVFGIFASLL